MTTPPPVIFGRASWGAKGVRGAIDVQAKPIVVFHHFGDTHVRCGDGLQREAEVMRYVENYHVRRNGWLGIGYNFVIFQSGHVYEGRGWGRIGAHEESVNRRSVGIAFAVRGQDFRLTQAAIEAARGLLELGTEDGHIEPSFQLGGHRDYDATVCPGDKVYEQLSGLDPRGVQ